MGLLSGHSIQHNAPRRTASDENLQRAPVLLHLWRVSALRRLCVSALSFGASVRGRRSGARGHQRERRPRH
jgi:hypothetical protein